MDLSIGHGHKVSDMTSNFMNSNMVNIYLFIYFECVVVVVFVCVRVGAI